MTATPQVDIRAMRAAAPAAGEPLRPADELFAQRGRQRLQFLGAERLQQIVVSAKGRRVQRAGSTAVSGHQDDFGVWQLRLKASQHRKTVLPAQHHIAKNNGPAFLAHPFKRSFGGRGSTYFPTLTCHHGSYKSDAL